MIQKTLTIEQEDWEGIMPLVKKANEILLDEGRKPAKFFTKYNFLRDRLETANGFLVMADLENTRK